MMTSVLTLTIFRNMLGGGLCFDVNDAVQRMKVLEFQFNCCDDPPIGLRCGYGFLLEDDNTTLHSAIIIRPLKTI